MIRVNRFIEIHNAYAPSAFLAPPVPPWRNRHVDTTGCGQIPDHLALQMHMGKPLSDAQEKELDAAIDKAKADLKEAMARKYGGRWDV